MRRRASLTTTGGLLAACGDNTAITAPATTGTAVATQAAITTTVIVTPTAAAVIANSTPAVITGNVAPASTITIISSFGQAGHPINKVVESFNASQGKIKATHQAVASGDYQAALQKAQADAAAGKPPSVVLVGWSYLPFAAQQLGAVSMEELGGAETAQVFGRFNPLSLQQGQLNGKQYLMPYSFSVPIVYYNDDVFKAQNAKAEDVFKSWNVFGDQMKALSQKASKDALGLWIGDAWNHQTFIESAGGRVLDDNGKPVFDSPDAEAGISAMTTLYTSKLSVQAPWTDLQSSFQAGNILTLAHSPASLGAQRTNSKFNVGVAPFPEVVSGKPLRLAIGGNGLGVFAKEAAQRQAAWEFVKFASSNAGVDQWAPTGYVMPTTYTGKVLPGGEVAYKNVNAGVPWIRWPGANGLKAEKAFLDGMQKILYGQSGIKEGLAETKKQVLALLA